MHCIAMQCVKRFLVTDDNMDLLLILLGELALAKMAEFKSLLCLCLLVGLVIPSKGLSLIF